MASYFQCWFKCLVIHMYILKVPISRATAELKAELKCFEPIRLEKNIE